MSKLKQFFIIFLSFCCWSLTAAVWDTHRTISVDLPRWVSFDFANGKFIYVDATSAVSVPDGSAEKPYKTISAALAVANPHDEIIIASGTYHETLRISKPHITLRADQLRQARVVSPSNDKTVYFALRIDPGAHFTRVIGLDISGGYFYTVSLESGWSKSAPLRKGVSHVLLSQNRLHSSGRDVLKLKPMTEHTVIERNEIFNSGMRDSTNAEGIDNVNSHYMTVQDNYIHTIATTGLYAKGGASNNVIKRNLIRNVGFAGILVGFDTSPDFFDLKTNPEMFEAINTRVENNIIDGTQASGIGIYAAKDVSIWHNTVVNSAQTYHSALFFGNTLQDKRAEAVRPESRNINISNNLFHTKHRSSASIIIRYMNDRDIGPVSALNGMPNMANNVYSSINGWVSFSDMRPTSLLKTTRQLKLWQKHTASDTGSKNIYFNLDKHYRLIEQASFTIPVQSSIKTDFYGRNRDDITSIGAIN